MQPLRGLLKSTPKTAKVIMANDTPHLNQYFKAMQKEHSAATRLLNADESTVLHGKSENDLQLASQFCYALQ